jgi:hypothetical protein
MVFKGTVAYLERIQSACDNIVDILENLEKMDSDAMRQIRSGNREGLSDEDHYNIRSLKIELEKYVKKFEDDSLTPSPSQAKEGLSRDLEQFCAKTTTLIECLLPKVIQEEICEEAEYERSDGAISDLSRTILLDQEVAADKQDGTVRPARPRRAKKKMPTVESSLQMYIVQKKHAIIKLAVNKLHRTIAMCRENAEIDTPKPLQLLFNSMMESVGPYLKPKSTSFTPSRESLLLGKQNSSLEIAKQNSIATSSLNLLERSKSVVQPPASTQQNLMRQPTLTEKPEITVKSQVVLKSELKQKQAKLWLVLYLLKKFGIPRLIFAKDVDDQNKKLTMDPKDPKYISHQQDQLFNIVKQVLRSNPLESGATLVRKLAVKVVLLMSVNSENLDQSTSLNITGMLLQDQDYNVREVFLDFMRDLLPKFYLKNVRHFDSICTQEQVLSEKNFYVKKLILKLMVQRCTFLAKASEGGTQQQTQQATISSNDAANDLVRVLCTEIRAMHKEMRIFCAGLLTQIDQCVPTQTVIQMMQKESMLEQKFVQIGSFSSNNFASGGSAGSAATSKIPSTLKAKPLSSGAGPMASGSAATGTSMATGEAAVAKAPVPQSQPIELTPQVTGILLLMLEDDSNLGSCAY